MERIGVRELRQHASSYLALVKAGQSVEVTERGELVALLVPPSPGDSARHQLINSGVLLPATGRSGRLRRPRPVSVAEGDGDGAGEPTNAQLLDAQRADRW